MTKPSSFADRLQAAQQLTYRRTLLYGPSRAGKTTFLGSAGLDPRTSPILILDFGGGSSSLSGLPDHEATIFPVDTWDDFNDAYEYLAEGSHPFKSVAIDSLSDTHLYALLNIVDQAVAETKGKRTDLEIHQGDYGKAMIQMRRFLMAVRQLPMHAFFTALAKTENEPREGWVRKPSLFGQMAEEVVGMFDATGFITLSKSAEGKIERILVLQNYPGVRAGIRTPFGKTIPNELILGPANGVTQLFDVFEVPYPTENK